MDNSKGKHAIIITCFSYIGAAATSLQQTIGCYQNWSAEYNIRQFEGLCFATGIALLSDEA
ncbi:hypothetical protein [Rheinheimera sp. 1928-s]|uniref:hypothetical protein n=1 Tax=Rheinheimera sp. 1928-s TaxID=3033803 RepID=UPI002613E527|nr:hypothetical protein [Rheinheimera sp. 1928-s]MDF3125970.1 hypothetical protein [Rheinheimera sp. 1928-s]